jgi:hypothetical protein
MKPNILQRIKWKNVLLALTVSTFIVYIIMRLIHTLWTSPNQKYDMMPSNAVLYFQSNTKNNLLAGKDISPLATQFINTSIIGTYLEQTKSIQIALRDSHQTESLSGFYEVTNHSYDFLHVVYIGFHWNHAPEQFFNAAFLANNHFQKRIFKSYVIYENNAENANFSYTYKNGFLIISHASDLIDNFIRKYDKNEVLNENKWFRNAQSDFENHAEGANHSPLQIIINYREATAISELCAQSVGEGILGEIAHLNGFSILDLNINQSLFSLHGCSSFDASSFNFKANASTSNATNISAYLPNNTAIISSFDIPTIKPDINEVAAMLDAGKADKMAFFVLENRDINYEKYAGCIIHTNNLAAALAKLKKFNSQEQTTISYGNQKIPLQGTTIHHELEDIFSHHFFHLSSPYYFYINNCLILVNKTETAQYIADHYYNKNTLSDHQASNYKCSIQQDLLPQLAELLFKSNDTAIDLSSLTSINHFSFLINNQNKELATEINFSVDKKTQKESTNIIWQSNLESHWIITPSTVEMPNEEKFYVVAQDDKNQIYFYNDAGELQWKKQIDSKLVSPFYPIDYYNNASIQFVFHSENNLYIVDKYGNNIGDFPIRLGAITNQPMYVYYDKKSWHLANYFIPCSNGNIYGYDIKGSPLAGWNPKKSGVLTALQSIPQNNSLLLLGTGIDGKIIGWDLKGIEKINLSAQLFVVPHFSVIAVDTNTYLFNSNQSHLLKYGLDGKMEEKPFGPATDSFDYIAFLPANSKVPNHAILEQNTLKIVDQTGKKIAAYVFTEKMNLHFKHFVIRNEDAFICTNLEATKTYIIRANGEILDGFPANLSTPLSIINIGGNTYAVGIEGDQKTVCYRL